VRSIERLYRITLPIGSLFPKYFFCNWFGQNHTIRFRQDSIMISNSKRKVKTSNIEESAIMISPRKNSYPQMKPTLGIWAIDVLLFQAFLRNEQVELDLQQSHAYSLKFKCTVTLNIRSEFLLKRSKLNSYLINQYKTGCYYSIVRPIMLTIVKSFWFLKFRRENCKFLNIITSSNIFVYQ